MKRLVSGTLSNCTCRACKGVPESKVDFANKISRLTYYICALEKKSINQSMNQSF